MCVLSLFGLYQVRQNPPESLSRIGFIEFIRNVLNALSLAPTTSKIPLGLGVLVFFNDGSSIYGGEVSVFIHSTEKPCHINKEAHF
jgi:hypothetical protein